MTQITRLTASDYQTSNWSGGKTTQVFLYPAAASYTDRTFDFRLSTATIEQEVSQFSQLEGFQRILMTLDQPITIHNHTLKQTIQLAPFTSYAFDGGDEIVSQGTCQDFNLIYTPNYQGYMKVISNGESLSQAYHYQFLYALCPLVIKLGNKTEIHLETQDLLVIQNTSLSTENPIMLVPLQSGYDKLAIWTAIH